MTTITKVKSASPMGEYKPTEIDAIKAEVGFRLLQVSPYVIRWKSGKTERVNKRQLDKLKKDYTWVTDF